MENGENLIHSFNNTDYSEGNFKGLTKREYFAGLAMQGLLSNRRANPAVMAEAAVAYADALLKELDKPQHPQK
jgi:hypothetical protein